MNSFEQYLQLKGIIPTTIARHQREVQRYTQWLMNNYCIVSEAATQKILLTYLQYSKESRNLCNATQNHILQVFKNYYSHLSQSQGISNITAFIKIRGVQRKHITYLFTPDELDALCDAYYHFIRTYIPSNKELRYCNDHQKMLQGRYIALTLMAYQGLQVHEVEALTQNSFDVHKGTVTIQQSRKGAERKIPLEPLQIGALMHYYAHEDIPLVANRNHFEHLTITLKTLHQKYKDLRQLRASTITHWLKLHGLRKAQYLAGHRNIHSTEKYLTGEVESLQNDVNSFHPLK